MTRIEIYRLQLSGIGELYKTLLFPDGDINGGCEEHLKKMYPVKQGWLVLVIPMGQVDVK